MMRIRSLSASFLLVAMMTMTLWSSVPAAPASHFKNFLTGRSLRAESGRRLLDASRIHFINSFMSLPAALPPPAQFLPSHSPIYKLPLKLFSNAKPIGIIGFGQKPMVEFIPHGISNVIRLPLKYISNAKPIGVYFKSPFNFL